MKKQILKLFMASVFALLITPFVFLTAILKTDGADGAEKIGFGYPYPYVIQEPSGTRGDVFGVSFFAVVILK